MAIGPALAPLAGTLLQVLSPGPAIDVVAVPPDTRCPPPAELALAVASRVPEDLAGWVAWYRVEARLEPPVENHVRFELRDGGGRVRLRRELAILDDGCAAAAQGLALIVERFFERVAWTASVPLPDVERPAEPPAARRWELQLGAGGRREIALAPALAIDARVALSGAWLAAAGLVLQPGSVFDFERAQIELVTLPARLSLRRVLPAGGMAFEVGPAVGIAGERAWVIGAGTAARYRVTGTLGLVIAARRPLSRTWAVALEVAADLTLPLGSFALEEEGEILRPAPVQVMGMLAVSRAISP